LAFLAGHQESDRTVSLKNVSCKHERINPQAGRNWLRKPAATQHGPGEAAERWMMGDVIKGSVSHSESIPDAKMGYLTGQIGGRDASISQGIIFSSSVIPEMCNLLSFAESSVLPKFRAFPPTTEFG